MKLKNIFSIVFASVLVLAGCVQEESMDFLPSLQVSQTYLSIAPAGSSAEITLNANTNWSIEEIADWLTASAMSGSAGETTIKFTAPSCDYGREAVVKIKVGLHTQFITVRQGAMTVEAVSCKEAMTGTAGKTYRVSGVVTSIVNTTYGNLYINDGSGIEAYVYGTLNADGEEKKFGDLDIEVGDIVTVEGPLSYYGTTPELVNVTVIDHSKSLLKVDTESVLLAAKGDEFTVKAAYKGSGAYAAISDDLDWLSLKNMDYVAGIPTKLEKNPADTAVFHFVAAANSEGSRSGSIEFSTTQDTTTTTMTVSVTQLGLAGTAEIPFTIKEAIEFCSSLTGPTSENFYVKGIVSKIPSQFSAKYGNAQFWLSEDGVFNNDKKKDFEGYNVYWFDNKQWVEGNGIISEGDEVVLCGQLTNYNGTCETNGKKAWIVSINGFTADTKGMNLASALSIKEACALCADLKANTPNMYYVQGIVSELTKYQYGASYNTASFWLTDDGTTTAADKFEAYSIYYMNNKGLKSDVKWPENGTLIAVGQKIVLRGYLTNYNGTCETASKKAYIVSIDGKTE